MMYDETTGLVVLIVLLIGVVLYIVYLLFQGATYVLVAILGALYTALAVIGSVLLAGLDLLLVPRQLSGMPWAAWAGWGALAGTMAGFWTVAPVYGLRRLRPVLLLLTPVAMLAVCAAQLLLLPPAQRQLLTPPPPTAREQVDWLRLSVPLRFAGTGTSTGDPPLTYFDIEAGGERHSCPDILSAAPLDAEAAKITGPSFIGVKLRESAEPPYNGALEFDVRLRPSLSGVAGTDTFWSADTNHGGYIVWFIDPAGTRVLFTLVIEPDSEYRFIDGALRGQGETRGGAREYSLSQRAGVLGMSRQRQRLRVDWQPRGFRQENGELLLKAGDTQWYGAFTFPEGDLLIDITPLE